MVKVLSDKIIDHKITLNSFKARGLYSKNNNKH